MLVSIAKTAHYFLLSGKMKIYSRWLVYDYLGHIHVPAVFNVTSVYVVHRWRAWEAAIECNKGKSRTRFPFPLTVEE